MADIGTDHALLPIYLVGSGRVPRAIAGDVSPGSYNKALQAVAAAGLSAKIDVRLGPGLSILVPGEADVLIIAGLGGLTIADILAGGREVATAAGLVLLQPMRDPAELRRRLGVLGFCLKNEMLVREGDRFYVLIAAVPGAMPAYSETLLEIGPLLVARPDPLLVPYVKARIARERQIWEWARKARGEAGRARAYLAEERIRAWEELVKCRSVQPE
ncbi:MAG: tRNA (adenine22-N1)-methyltransferase [Bacillota bacterium]|nr:tRNA (adenine22-N1)-methyltransferase [Bacillota bacterium]MDK2924326.1 tRNA (adenine22-N1)-methyltransferase [Bacillota bacterium]